jgi:SAM-dependent methyltransferase
VDGEATLHGTDAHERIVELALAYRRSSVLFAAVELGVFAAVSSEPLDAEAIGQRVGLDRRGARDFLDALVALDLLERDRAGRYATRADAAAYLDPSQVGYVGALVTYQQRMLAPTWARLGEALRDGKPKGGVFAAGGFEPYYDCADKADRFVTAMAAGSLGPARALAARFPWKRYRSLADIGTADGAVAVEIAKRHAHVHAVGFDLPVLEARFTRNSAMHDLARRVTFRAGDFLADPLPRADVLVMGRILHDWPQATRCMLIEKALAALEPGGALVVWDALIDDRRRDARGLIASLNMLLQTDGGGEYTARECAAWMRAAGFGRVRTLGLFGPYKAVVATLPRRVNSERTPARSAAG